MATATETKMFYSRHSYGTIVDMFDDTVVVQNEQGKQWTVSRAIFDAEFKITEPGDVMLGPAALTRTEMIDLIKQNQRNIMVVTFRKKPKPVEVRKVLNALLAEGLHTNQTKFKQRFDDAAAGPKRVMFGRHEGAYDDHGRLYFVDMERKGMRTVDLRTVESVFVNGRLYNVK